MNINIFCFLVQELQRQHFEIIDYFIKCIIEACNLRHRSRFGIRILLKKWLINKKHNKLNNLPFKYIIIMMFLFTRISLKSV